MTGNCYFLLDSRIISRISRQWRFLAPLMRSLVNSNIHQKPTVQNRLYFVFVYVVAACYALPVPSAQPCSDGYSLADVAGVDVSEEAKKIAMERFDTYAKKDRRRYFECIDNLLEKLNEHQAAGHWRYLVGCQHTRQTHIPCGTLAYCLFLRLLCVACTFAGYEFHMYRFALAQENTYERRGIQEDAVGLC